MSSSFMSHFRPSSAQKGSESKPQRKQSSRIPTKSSSLESKTPHASKLSKRVSRTLSTSNNANSASTSLPRATTQYPSSITPVSVVSRQSELPSAVPTGKQPVQHENLPPPPVLRTPSLVSGSSASTVDSPRSNGLRRKPSTIDKFVAQKRSEILLLEADRATMHSRSENYNEAMDDSVFGISLPSIGRSESAAGYFTTDVQAMPTPNLYHMDPSTYQYDIPITAGSVASATPSTRHTDSPFSHVPTPSSMSSYSPAIVSASSASRYRPDTPEKSRPPVSGKGSKKEEASRLGLPLVREASTSSSGSANKASRPSTAASKVNDRRTSGTPVVARMPTVRQNTSTDQGSTRSNAVSEKRLSARAPARVPPELAHLNVETVTKPTTYRPVPPSRPSREGTPLLTDFKKPSPVVQSELPSLYTTYHKRTPSLETPVSATSSSFRSRFGFSPKPSSKHNSPRIDSAISPTPSDRNFVRGPTPDLASQDTSRLRRQDSPAIGTSQSPAKSHRFGFLTRKPKGEAPKVLEKPRREPRKGPVAGTGHEGYGRYGFRGRSGSTSASSNGRSPSTDSSTSSVARASSRRQSVASKTEPDLDAFLRERLNPVILRGSGSTFGNATTGSVVSIPDSVQTQSTVGNQQPSLLPSAMQTQLKPASNKRLSYGGRSPLSKSESETESVRSLQTSRPTMGARQGSERSLTRTMTDETNDLIRSYTSETNVGSTVPLGQKTRTKSPVENHLVNDEGQWLRSVRVEEKPTKKWNFFQRAHSSPSKGKQKARAPSPAAFNEPRTTNFDNAAHCALIDTVEPIALDEVERLVMENEISSEESSAEGRQPPKVVPYERRHSSLLPSPPPTNKHFGMQTRPSLPTQSARQDTLDSAKVLLGKAAPPPRRHAINLNVSKQNALQDSLKASQHYRDDRHNTSDSMRINTPELTPANGSPRQPRLSPVGRIPRVVSKRDRDRKLPDTSFSRPFASTQPRPSVRPPGSLYNQIRELASPIESVSQSVWSTSGKSDGPSTTSQRTTETADQRASIIDFANADLYGGPHLFTHSPRKLSDLSNSSSSGNNSWMASLPGQTLQMEDVWNEYNDLMDEVMLGKVSPSAEASLGVPMQAVNLHRDTCEPSTAFVLGLPRSKEPTSALPLPPPRPSGEPTTLSVPQQVSQFLRSSLSPLTPDTLSHFVAAYGGNGRESMSSQHRQSIPQVLQANVPPSRNSVGSSRNSRISAHSRSASLPDGNLRSSHTSFSSGANFEYAPSVSHGQEVSEEERSISNLKWSAIMTSKWLSFGRVLFSPAHNKMHLADESRVLVVDGLGSDWASFVALSYPQATVYNLGLPSRQGPMREAWHSMSNLRHIAHTSISAPFPFPKGFFTAVVFRFPAATSDQAYFACISECKRVLRLGGHLEVSVLDLDLTNMGTRARGAIRGLKTRIQQNDENVSLRSLSDSLVRLIGRRGFEDVQRCVVGVPVAGRIPRSHDISSVSSDSSGNHMRVKNESGVSEKRGANFVDLLEHARNSQIEANTTSDEDITKMAAKVGRWWYSSCYEKALLNKDKSIWSDRNLLRECETQGTSFRLLICYAQKPMQAPRRTMSV